MAQKYNNTIVYSESLQSFDYFSDTNPVSYMYINGETYFIDWCFAPADQTGAMQVRVFRRAQTGSGRIVWPGPTFAVIVQVPEHVEVFLPARRAGIEGLAA